MKALRTFSVLMIALPLVGCFGPGGCYPEDAGCWEPDDYGCWLEDGPLVANTPSAPAGPATATNPSTPPADTTSPPTAPTTVAAAPTNKAANPCTTPACSAGSYCEVQTAQSGLGPPPEEQAATETAGLGPPPQEQAATPTAGLGPPPNNPAVPPPAGPSSPGTAMLTPPVVVPVPISPPAQPPTARYNPPNVCNPTPAAPLKPANICNSTPPAISKPGNICNPTGNAGQQTAATPQNLQSAPTASMNSGECHTVNGQTTCTDAVGHSCTTTGGFCDPTNPQQGTSNTAAPGIPPKPNAGPLNLKPNTQMASAGQPCNQKNQTSSVPACESKPPYLPWGGTGSAMITVSGGKPCGVGWHDTPGGPGGVTVLDSMTVASQPSHGSAASQGHSVIYTPAPGYKGQDAFTLSMQEHNGGRNATLRVKVSVTIQ